MNRVVTTAFERLGADEVRAIVRELVERMARDPMIGFFFARSDLERLAEREYELAAGMLGADVPYLGKPLREAHAAHRIFDGQFARRREILRQLLVAHSVPEDVREEWLSHVDASRDQIVAGQCAP